MKNYCKSAIAIVLLATGGVQAASITVKNATNKNLYVASYTKWKNSNDAYRYDGPKQINAGSSVMIEREEVNPLQVGLVNRNVYYSHSSVALQERLSLEDQQRIASLPLWKPVGKTVDVVISEYMGDQEGFKKDGATLDNVSVENKSNRTVYIAIYRKPKDATYPAVRYSDNIVEITPGAQGQTPRPSLSVIERLTNDRILVFVMDKSRLKAELPQNELKQLSYIAAGSTQGSVFYITGNEGEELQGYNSVTWNLKPVTDVAVRVVDDTKKALTVALDPMIQKTRQLFLGKERNPYGDQQARVRYFNDKNFELVEGEKAYLEKRKEITRKTQENLLGIKLKRPLCIGLSNSGGGFRAMTGTAGTLKGFDDLGMISAFTYMTGLSGSTWAMAPWYSSNLSLKDFYEVLSVRASGGIPGVLKNVLESPEIIALLATNLLKSLAFGRSVSLIDLYGFLLGRNLLKEIAVDEKGEHIPAEYITLTDHLHRLVEAELPFPLYTAVIDNTSDPKTPYLYQWMEFSPYEVASEHLKGGVPAWSFGRDFNQGLSIDNEPPYNLGYLMGVWGSAPSVSFRDVADQMLKKLKPEALANLFTGLANTDLGDAKAIPVIVPNYTYNISGTPFAQKKAIGLVDAGLSSGNPVYPLLNKQRVVEVILVVDFSGTPPAEELQRAVEHARKEGYKLPDINYEVAAKENCSIWTDEDPSVPTVIYIPRLKNPAYKDGFDPEKALNSYANTFNFLYKKEQFQEFAGMYEFTVKQYKDQILDAIRKKAEQVGALAA